MKYLDVKTPPQNDLEKWNRWLNHMTVQLISHSIYSKKINVVIDNDNDWAFAWVDKDDKKQMAVF